MPESGEADQEKRMPQSSVDQASGECRRGLAWATRKRFMPDAV
jgi:hypothetical protein